MSLSTTPTARINWDTGAVTGDATTGDLGVASVISTNYDPCGAKCVGIEFTGTGTPTGTVTIEVSNSLTTWYSVMSFLAPAFTQPAGSFTAQMHVLDETLIACRALRINYARTGGTGTIIAHVTRLK